MADYLNIAGRVRTTASDGVAMEAQEVKDLNLNKSQQEINADVQTALGDRYTKEETYSKEQLNELITTPDVNYVSVVATNATTAVTDILPATGEANTIYRVGNWNGTQYDPTMYALFAWNGTTYVCLAVRSFVGEVYDISANHPDGQGNPTPYADLDAALGTSGANIPADIRRGGMSIKFIQGTVQSSDNKYVQYRLKSKTWSINTDDWSFCGDDVFVENPEFIRVVIDKEGRILWAIETNGNIRYGAGVPQQIIDYIEKKIADLSLDEYEDIVAFLDSLIEGDKTLQQLLDEKVDKIDGKSLIDEDYAAQQSAIDNHEFLEVTLDNDEKILEGRKTDGRKVINGGVDVEGDVDLEGCIISFIDNPEFVKVYLDSENRILFAIKKDADIVLGFGVPTQIKDYISNVLLSKVDKEEGKGLSSNDYTDDEKDVVNTQELVENPEYMSVETDVNGYVLSGREKDGTRFENMPVKIPAATIESMDDPEERSELKTDSEGRIISYRDKDGVLHENLGINTPELNAEHATLEDANIHGGSASLDSLNLTESGMTEFQQALKAAGFRIDTGGDWSDYDSQGGDYPLVLPMPKCAFINIISDYDLTQLSKEGYSSNPPYWPAGVEGETYDIPTQVEFYDGLGNYFKKWSKMSGQGNSSMGLEKKNIALDFFDDETMDGAFTTRFGDWVEQDSYHLKAFYTDAFRCVSPVTYQLYDEMISTRGIFNDYFWKRALIDFSTITATENWENSSSEPDADRVADNDLKFESGAKCFPKGFPCIVFQNGEFWGVYSFQLKKNRKNYHQEKENKNHIQLDGTVSADTIFSANGDSSLISWIPGTDAGFEVRNPKADNFVTASGGHYIDYARTSQELAGIGTLDTVVDAYDHTRTYAALEKCVKDNRMYLSRVADNTGNDPTNASYGNKVKDVWKKATQYWIEITYTNDVKTSILQLSTYYTKLHEKEQEYLADRTPEKLAALKETFETYLDPANLIDYLIIADTVGGISAAKNWQWLTYDGIKWYVGLYDCDNALGQYFSVTEVRRAPHTGNSHAISYPFHYFIVNYYNEELEAQYKVLRDAGIISVKHIVELVKEWQGKIGKKYYMTEFKKWSGSTRFDSLFRLEKWITAQLANIDTVYHYN